jgi:hypothetical protein
MEPKSTYENTSSGNPPAKHIKTSHNFGVDIADIPDNRAFPHLHTLFDRLTQTFLNNADIGPSGSPKICGWAVKIPGSTSKRAG